MRRNAHTHAHSTGMRSGGRPPIALFPPARASDPPRGSPFTSCSSCPPSLRPRPHPSERFSLGLTHHHSGRLQTQRAPAQEESQPGQHSHPAKKHHKLFRQEDTLNIHPGVRVSVCVYSQDEQPAGLFGQSQQDEQTHYEVKKQQQHIRQPPVMKENT